MTLIPGKKSTVLVIHEQEVPSSETIIGPEDASGERAPVQLSRSHFWPTLGIMVASLSSCGIDLNVLGDAAITIATHFSCFDRLIWMSASTVMVAAGSILVWGRLYSTYETKFLLVVALLIMAISELLAGLSKSFSMFICGRILTGLALSNVLVGTITVTSLVTNGLQRPLFVGLVTGCFGLMMKVGPFISGGLLERSTRLWRWCFLLQLPLIGTILLVTLLWFPKLGRVMKPHQQTHDEHDVRTRVQRLAVMTLTALLQAGSIVCLIFPLMAGASYGWTSINMIICYVSCPIFGLAFILLENRSDEARRFLPLTAIRQDRTMLCMGAVTFCNCLIVFPSVFYLPLTFQVVFNSSPLKAAVQMLPNALLGTIACVASGKIAATTGSFTLTCILLSLVDTLACGLIWSLRSMDPLWKVYLYTCILGVSSGGLSAITTPVIIERVALTKLGSASAFINLCIVLGAAAGLAGSSVLYNAKIVSVIETIVVSNPSLASILSSSDRKSPWLQLGLILSPATTPEIKATFKAGFMQAFDQAHLFYLGAGVLCLIASIACPHKVMLSHRKKTIASSVSSSDAESV